MAPGPTELTRMPCGPSASARAFGYQHHAALAGGEADGESGTSDAAHAGHQHDAAGPALGFHRLRGGLRVEQHSFQGYRDQSVEVGLGDIGTSWCAVIPAFATMTSIPPNSTEAATRASRSPRLMTSVRTNCAATPSAVAAATVGRPPSRGVSVISATSTALAPWRAAESDAARPRPLEALVTTTTLPARMSLIATPKHAGVSSVWRRSL